MTTSPTPSIVLIAGDGRSGSSLLELLLTDRLSAVSVGELKNLWQRGMTRGELCSCGNPAHLCTFWTSVYQMAFQDATDSERIDRLRRSVDRHRKFIIHRYLRIPSARYRKLREEYLSVIRTLYHAIHELSGGRTIIDSSKDPAHVDLVLEAFPNSTVIHLVRDARAVTYSAITPKRRTEVYWTTELTPPKSALRAVVDWSVINLLVETITRRKSTNLLLRYEDLVGAQDVTMSRCSALLEQDAGAKGALYHSVSGNPMRFSAEPLVVRPDVRWQTKLSVRKKLLVTFLSFPLLQRYGYPLNWLRGARDLA